MRVVLDTNVPVAAVRSRRGASNAILVCAFQGRFDWLMSVPLFLEYEQVLTRTEILLETGIRITDMSMFLSDIGRIVKPVELHFLWRPQLRDPGDEMVLETVVNGRADVLVTHNGRDFVGAESFGLTVLTPARFLTRIRR